MKAKFTVEPKIPDSISSSVSASWKWNDQSQGLIQWTFQNSGTEQKTVVLLRNGYYFAGAYFCIYLANPQFNTTMATSLTPLVDNGVENNNPPMGVVSMYGGLPKVYFLFTLAPGQTWSMLEGGFSASMLPSGIAVYEVTLTNSGQWCIGYDPQRVADWDAQTGTTLQGYSPNPSVFNTIEVTAESDAPYDILPYDDNIVQGNCSGVPPMPPTPSTCPVAKVFTRTYNKTAKFFHRKTRLLAIVP